MSSYIEYINGLSFSVLEVWRHIKSAIKSEDYCTSARHVVVALVVVIIDENITNILLGRKVILSSIYYNKKNIYSLESYP